MLLFNCRSAQQSPPASAQSHLLWTMTNQTEITTIPQLLAPSGYCYLNLTQLAQTTEWRASGIQQRINILCFGTKNRTIILNSLQQDFMHMNVCITGYCVHAQLLYMGNSYQRWTWRSLLQQIIITTDDVPGKMQILYIKPYGEATGTLSWTIKMLLPQSPPTHRLMNPHHLCTKFNFVLLIVAWNLNILKKCPTI